MPDLPTFRELYDEFKAEVLKDDASRLNDFSAGSFLDAFAAVCATSARSIQRWILRQMKRAFVSDATGADLDYVIVDRYGDEMVRLDGESDADYRRRVDDWLAGLGRGTPEALRVYATGLEGVVSVLVVEGLGDGTTTVDVEFDENVTTEAKLRDVFFDDLDKWRSIGDSVNLEAKPS